MRPISGQAGFSLLELMIVLTIIGIATALASVGLVTGPDSQSTLRREADRLAQLFPVAQAQARSAGRDVLWEADAKGYHFRYPPSSLILPAALQASSGEVEPDNFSTDDLLRPRTWPAGLAISVELQPRSANRFSGEWMPDPVQITLRHDGLTVSIHRDATGRYEVLP